MNLLTAITSLLLLAAAPALTTTTVADRKTIGLAESVAVTLVLEGPAPLRIEPPTNWLSDDSEAIWRISAIEPAKVEPRPGERERWSLRLRVEPFLPGEAVPLQFASAKVTAGGDSAPQPISWDGLEVRVITTLDASTAKPRPITGLELPAVEPTPVAATTDGRLRVAVAFASIALAGLMLVVARRLHRRVPESPSAWALRELARLSSVTESTDFSRILDRVLNVCRVYLERTTGVPATRLTVTEFAVASQEIPEAKEWRSFLESNDAGRFAGAGRTREQVLTAIEEANRLIARLMA